MRPRLFLALLTLAACSAHADDGDSIYLRREVDQSLTLVAPNCAEVSQQIAAFRSWTARLGEALGPEPVPAPSAGSCSAGLNGSVPNVIAWFEGKSPMRDGPNCWNSALLANRMAQFARYSSDFEFTLWMNSAYCQHLNPSDLLLPGDTIAIRSFDLFGLSDGEIAGDDRRRETHTFIYVTDDLAFSKNGLLGSIPYETQSLEKIYRTYNLTLAQQSCRRAAWNVSASQCRVWAEAFRCTPPDRDLSSFESDSRWTDLLERVRVAEQEASDFVFGKDLDPSMLTQLQSEIELLIEQVEPYYDRLSATRSSATPDAKNLFFLQVTLHRLWSLRDQVGALQNLLVPQEPWNGLPWAPGGEGPGLEYPVKQFNHFMDCGLSRHSCSIIPNRVGWRPAEDSQEEVR